MNDRGLLPPEAPASGVGARTSEPLAGLTSWAVMLLLLALMLYTIVDRPLFSLVVEPLKKDLGLSDLQVGLVQGLSVALFTAVAGYPLGWLADRYDKRYILAGSIAVWSSCLALAGLAQNFGQIFIASALVGAGEAGLVPIAITLTAQLFRENQRQLANSLLLLGARLGVGLMIAVCGWVLAAAEPTRAWLPAGLQELAGWRLAFLFMALPGLVLVPLILMLPATAAQPPRVQHGGAHGPAIPAVWPHLRAHWRPFLCFYGGVGLIAFGIGCVMAFAPVVSIRQMGATQLTTGNLMGAATFIATVVGFLLAQGGTQWARRWVGERLPAVALLAAAAGSACAAAALMLASSPTTLFIGVGVFLTLIMAGTLLFPTAAQDLTPPPLRARLVSIMATTNIVLGALGPAAVGAVSDQLKGHPQGPLLAMAGCAAVGLLGSIAFLLPLTRLYLPAVRAARAG
ncbi:MAG: MFS transporter [Betaproteobacteria bacterium]|jgi:MFS family permease|nr:MFS transporter [Rubrivivax sp.]